MKKLLILLVLVIIACTSCADSKTFKRADGTSFVAEPYGWGNYQSNKIEGVVYELNVGNVVWDVLLFETIIVPVWLTGWELYEPVSYVEPNVVK